jgi:hypothetical protein
MVTDIRASCSILSEPFNSSFNSIFYLSTTITAAFTSNYRVNLLNINTSSDNNRSFIITIISDVSGNASKYYANSITASSTSAASVTVITPTYLGGSSAIDITSASTTFQQVNLVYTSGLWRIFTNISSFTT